MTDCIPLDMPLNSDAPYPNMLVFEITAIEESKFQREPVDIYFRILTSLIGAILDNP